MVQVELRGWGRGGGGEGGVQYGAPICDFDLCADCGPTRRGGGTLGGWKFGRRRERRQWTLFWTDSLRSEVEVSTRQLGVWVSSGPE